MKEDKNKDILKLTIGEDGSEEQRSFEIPLEDLKKYEVINNKESDER